jgi:protocatechuate 3,4-dioxygenase beta subunit
LQDVLVVTQAFILLSRLWSVAALLWPLIALSPALGQQTQADGVVGASGLQNSQAEGTPHSIHGTVVDSVTGEPISRALVQIGGQSATLTDHEGHFEFNGLAQQVQPWAMKPGYFPDRHAPSSITNSASSPAENNSDQSSAPAIIVKLVPEAVLSGTVTGSDGAPLEGIPVTLKALIVSDGRMHWRQRGQTRTNSEGQYRFAELEEGKYAVSTGFLTEGLAEAQSTVAYVPTRFPPAGDSQTSTAGATATAGIALGPGDHREANLSPDVERLYPVSGVMSGYGESRGFGFRVLTPSGEEISPSSRFNPRTGEFRILLPGGNFVVTATAYLQQGPLEGRINITVPQAPVSGVSFPLEPYATIPVEVDAQTTNTAATGQSNAGQSQPAGSVTPDPTLFGRTANANISLASTNESGFESYLGAQPLRRRGGDDTSPGPLFIENVAPGRYMLQAIPQSPWYVASASCGGVDLTRDELAISGGAAGCSIRVVLRNDSGSVHATLRDPDADSGQPANARQAFVYALPIGDLVRPAVTLARNGTGYSADSVAPGRYLVVALDHQQELAYRDPEALRRYASIGQEIAIAPNGTADAEVTLIKDLP